MPRVTLALHSEPYSPAGNLAADGFRKLLGAPSLDLVQTLVREAVQNSCDAALGDGNAEVHFRIRRLGQSQLESLRGEVLTELPRDEGSGSLREFLDAGEATVLEISDFNTEGLGGPTRADIAPSESEPTDFVDFLRNVGSPRNTFHGGGTYGYGKTSLYLASRCSTIVVDTQTRHRGSPVRRLMAARLGSAFEASDADGTRRRFTGRHWWGVPSGDELVDPVEGDDAAELAERLGLPQRGPQRPGTTIMILDPAFDVVEGRPLDLIREALLWFFWPRLIASTEENRRLRFRIFEEDDEVAIPAPEEFPPLDLFSRALNAIRQNDPAVAEIRSSRPRRLLGQLGLAKGLVGQRIMGAGEEGSLFPRRSSAIAVMRPVELVVRYYEGAPLADDAVEWGGVFVASAEPEVEEAFARAEPPAHDDWQPESIADRTQASMVRIAIREIRNAANEVANPSVPPGPAAGEGPSLAAVADVLGRCLVGQGREGAGPRARGGGSGGRRRANRVSTPVFRRLRQAGDRRIAVFSAMISGDGSKDHLLVLSPALAMDGGAVRSDDLLELPEVLAVRCEDRLLGDGDRIDVGRTVGDIEIEVVMPADCAVTLGARLETSGGEE